jgi:U6 snRNA phosphodiesterase
LDCRFRIRFTTLAWVSNYENTRWFLVLRIERPTSDELNRLLGASNSVVISFGQQPLYVPDAITTISHRQNVRGQSHGFRGGRERHRGPGYARGPGSVNTERKTQLDCSSHFHISLGWSLERPSQEMAIRTSSATVLAKLKTLTTHLVPEFEAVKVKVGNTVAVVPLPTKVKEGTGLIGL